MNRSTPLAALASALAVAGCGAGAEEDVDASSEAAAPAASPSGTSAVSPSGASTAAEISAAHHDADVMFAQGMIPHHEQAVEMSEILLVDPDVRPEVRELAEGVIAAQGPEIRRMHDMLEAWEEPVADSSGTDHGSMGHGSGVAGMMSEEDLSALEQAAGPEAARLYLQQMTVHHEGAVTMARNEVRDVVNPEAAELAEDVVAAQEAEIAEMRELLQGLPASS